MTKARILGEFFVNLIASVVVLSLVAYIGLAITSTLGTSLSAVGASWFALYAMVVIMSAIKLYGKGVYNAVRGLGNSVLSNPSSR